MTDITDVDRDLEIYLRKKLLMHGTYSTEDIRQRIAAHRIAAVAAREKEIVGMILEYANIANDRFTRDDLRKLCERIQTPSEGA